MNRRSKCEIASHAERDRGRAPWRRVTVRALLLASLGLQAAVGGAGCASDDHRGARTEPSVAGAQATMPDPVSDLGSSAATDRNAVATRVPGAFEAGVAALVAYRRRPVDLLSCPGLFVAGSCGNGRCDGLDETAENCPADCVHHAVGAYNDLPICTAYQQVVTPTTIAETQQAVRAAVAAGQRVRPIGRRHSASEVICGDGVALDMSKFADVGKTRIEGDVAYVQPGVQMIDLGDHLARSGRSIGFTHLGFRGVSVAGAIGTAAHGSSPVHTNALAQRVVSLQVVLADGSLRTFTADATPEHVWRTLTTSLGLLGVIVELGVRTEPAFQLEVDVTFHDEAELLTAGSPLELLVGCDFGQFNWFPKHRRFARWCGKKTDAPAQPGANNVLLDPGVGADIAPLAKTGFHAGTCDPGINALLESARLEGLTANPPLVIAGPDEQTRNVAHAIGPAHRMMSADLIALGKNKYFQMDWEVAVPEPSMREVLQAARRVFDAHDVSLPGVGVFLRFGKIEPGGWLAYHSAGNAFVEGQTAMFFESPVAVPVGYTGPQLSDYLHIYESLVGLFVRHLGARAHWGKNLPAVFDLQRSVGTYDGRIDKVNEAVAELDPYGVFANDFGRRIGVRYPRDGENFASALMQSDCACGVGAEPVCDHRSQHVFANRCRATCAGKASSDLIAGPCAAYVWGPCGALDGRTCVWDRIARERDGLTQPLLRF